MSEVYYKKVVSSSSEGKLEMISQESLEVLDQETLEVYLQGLFKLPKSFEQMSELIEFGKKIIGKENDRMDALALRVYENAYHSLSSLLCSDEQKLEFAKLVREGLGYLYHSKCEFVWEETGELLTACEEFIEKLSTPKSQTNG